MEEKPSWRRAALLLGLMLWSATISAQQTVYRCVEDDGSITFSDQPCSEEPDVLHIEETHNPPPPIQYSPRPSISSQSRPQQQNTGRGRSALQQNSSYRCSASNGEVWYRHSPCPSTITVRETEVVTGTAINTGNPVRGTMRMNRSLPVDQAEVPRATACSAIYRAGQNRFGADRDEKYDTYARNTGLDPCR